MNYGNCIGCNKIIGYDKFSICKSCEQKYIKQIMSYAYNHSLNVSTMELHKELEIPIKVLEYFQRTGLLKKIENNEEIKDEPVVDVNVERMKKIAMLGEIGKLVDEGMKNEETTHSNGMRMYTFKK